MPEKWPKPLNVTRHSENSWHGDISFARMPTDAELRNLYEFLREHHERLLVDPAEKHVGYMIKWALIENMVTVASTAALVLGLYWMGAGGHAGWGFLLLLNLNTPSRIKSVTSTDNPKG